MANSPRVVQQLPQMGRGMRRPSHPFQIEARPFQIQPFFIAPVLPGETMKNLLLQSRVVTDPIKNKLIGWWQEYYFFYIKHRDTTASEDLVDLMINPHGNLTPLNEAADVKYHHFGSYPNFAKLCLQRVVEEYFRNESETWNSNAIDGMPLAAINSDNAYQSMLADAAMVTHDVDVDLDADGTITASEVERAQQAWALLLANNLTDKTYEDYLRDYGIKTAKAEMHIPELVRYVREWSYPSNTVNPSDGSVASAVSWSITSRADKDRFFKEPGWLFGVTTTRPKVYLKTAGSVADLMNTAMSWLPAILMDDPGTSLKQVADATGPLGDVTDAGGYWVDIKDLLMYGDQFMNFANTSTANNLVALPSAGLQRRYVSSADVDALFVAASPANKIRQDGIVSMQIATRVRDTTPGPSPV